MKLRLWVKILFVILIIISILGFIAWDKQEYEKCMDYTNGNRTICNKLK